MLQRRHWIMNDYIISLWCLQRVQYSLLKECVQQHLPAQVWVSYVFPLISRPPLVFTNHSWGSRQHHLPTCWHTYVRCQKVSKWIINLWFPRLKYQLFGSSFISVPSSLKVWFFNFFATFRLPVGHWWKECSVTLKPASNEDFRICSALASSVKLTASGPLTPTSWRTKTFLIPKQNEASHVLPLANWPSKDFWG